MTDCELMQQALEALDEAANVLTWDGFAKAADALRERLTNSHDLNEPVAWLHWLFGPVQLFMNIDEAMLELERLNREYPVDGNARQMLPLYTAPQPRQWVGLTEEKIVQVLGNVRESVSGNVFLAFARAIEAKLREKNA